MAELRDRQKAGRERRILRAADALFRKRGYASTGMQDVAIRAQLAVGTLYNYFPSKSDLLAELLRRDTGDALAAGEAVVKHPPEDVATALDALLAIYGRLALRHDRGLWRELFGASIANPESKARRASFESDQRLIAQLVRLLEELRARGTVRAELDPGQGALALYAIYLTWFLAWVSADDMSDDTFRTQLRAGVEILVGGMRETPS